MYLCVLEKMTTLRACACSANTLDFSLLFTVSSIIFPLFPRYYFTIKIKLLVVNTIFYFPVLLVRPYAFIDICTWKQPECKLSLYLKKAGSQNVVIYVASALVQNI